MFCQNQLLISYSSKFVFPSLDVCCFIAFRSKGLKEFSIYYLTASFMSFFRLEKLKVEDSGPKEISQVANHKPALTQPEIQNNERNLQVDRDRSNTVTPGAEGEQRKQRDAERYGFQKDGAERERPLTKINSIKLQPAQAETVKANVTSPPTPNEAERTLHSPQVNGSGELCKANGTGVPVQQSPISEPERNLSRTSSMQQLEQWVRTQRGRGQDDDARRYVCLF